MSPKWSRHAHRIAEHLDLDPDTLAEPAEYSPEAHAMLEELTA